MPAITHGGVAFLGEMLGHLSLMVVEKLFIWDHDDGEAEFPGVKDCSSS